uniref:Uncharacterized protein n=1 Tax=Chrysotila carterae TaxID=13221 RepID=A0A7S4F2G8_CHRCT
MKDTRGAAGNPPAAASSKTRCETASQDNAHFTSCFRSFRNADAALLAFLCACAIYQWRGGTGPGCGVRAESGTMTAMLLHNRWNVFTTAEGYVVWEVRGGFAHNRTTSKRATAWHTQMAARARATSASVTQH